MTNTTVRKPLGFSAAILALCFAACSDDPTGPNAADECSTDVTAATDGTFVELCEVTGGPVRHVRIENFRAQRTHASAQLVFGFAVPPTSPTDPMGSGQFRVLFYGGGTPAPSPLVQASFGGVDAPLDGDAAFINAGATVCFDLHDGGANEAPHFILWVDGQRGADCEARATLTASSAFAARSFWHGATGAIAKDSGIYFRQAAGSGQTPRITLFAEPALEEAEITAATSCSATWTSNTEWQQMCAPAAGIARHVRLESVQASANNSYFYAVIGQDPGPTGNPAQSAGKLIVTGGRSNSGSSWTWFRFDNGTTTQFSYANAGGQALYTQTPATICFDVGTNDQGNARVVFWATGANQADCADRKTLTLARVLYDSAADPATASIWDVPQVAGKLNFVKTNTTSATIGNVVVMSEPAVLF
jgi:hypothetical protein